MVPATWRSVQITSEMRTFIFICPKGVHSREVPLYHVMCSLSTVRCRYTMSCVQVIHNIIMYFCVCVCHDCRAKTELDSGIVLLETWERVHETLDSRKLFLAPFCGETPCEDAVKKDSARYTIISCSNLASIWYQWSDYG